MEKVERSLKKEIKKSKNSKKIIYLKELMKKMLMNGKIVMKITKKIQISKKITNI